MEDVRDSHRITDTRAQLFASEVGDARRSAAAFAVVQNRQRHHVLLLGFYVRVVFADDVQLFGSRVHRIRGYLGRGGGEPGTEVLGGEEFSGSPVLHTCNLSTDVRDGESGVRPGHLLPHPRGIGRGQFPVDEAHDAEPQGLSEQAHASTDDTQGRGSQGQTVPEHGAHGRSQQCPAEALGEAALGRIEAAQPLQQDVDDPAQVEHHCGGEPDSASQ